MQQFLQGLNIPGATAYGKQDYPNAPNAAIVGQRNGNGQWNVYAQRYDSNPNTLQGVDHILVNG